MKKLKIAAIGCGARSTTYLTLASKLPTQYDIVAGADPTDSKVAHIKELSNNPNFKSFADSDALLNEDKLADIMIIGTQDKYHFEPCIKALKKGYDILLEKPIATSVDEIIKIEELANQLGRKVLVCFVLRYTPFFKKLKEIIDSGEIGDVSSLSSIEGVGPWHMGHSFVRGHWSKSNEASPLIVAKSCHDTDIIQWMLGKKCKEVQSYGELSYFTKDNKPKDAPKRCTDGCPVGEECIYNSTRYASDKREPWLAQIYPRWREADKSEILDWLKESKWGRCVYQCDNDVVDSQSVNMRFENNIQTTLTVSAFDKGRNLVILGTKGSIRGGEFYNKFGADIFVTNHASEETRQIKVEVIDDHGYDHHMGGDMGIVKKLYQFISNDEIKNQSEPSLIHSHLIAFAAEEARVTGTPINIKNYYNNHLKN